MKQAVIENVVMKQSKFVDRDIGILFEDEPVHFSDADDISVLMKEVGVFPSTSKARQAGRHGPIPSGFTEFKASKKRRLFIWNPDE